jgi:hypothetical protein
VFAVVVGVPAHLLREARNRVKPAPTLFDRHGASLLSLNLGDFLPAFAIEVDISDFHGTIISPRELHAVGTANPPRAPA